MVSLISRKIYEVLFFSISKWLIISKKPWFTGIQAGFQAEFTTNLLLLRERALICRPEPCKPSHQHTALRKNKWKLNTTQTRRFSIPTRENRNAAFFMPSCYAVGAKKALLYAALRARFCRGQGFIPNPGKMAFYRVTNPQPKEWWSYGSFPSGAQQGLYRYEQPPFTQQGADLKGKGAFVANAFPARRLCIISIRMPIKKQCR